MKINILNSKLFILITFFNICYIQNIQFIKDSYYYEEKYFRILSNNYETIDPGNMWTKDEDGDGHGFIAKKDFGSLILLKDWSMYNFKLTKIMFRNKCICEDVKGCSAEMWLIHTKDNGYYPPGRRIFMKQNYFIIIVPFVKTENENPAVDSIFYYLNLEEYVNKKEHISPKQPVKLYQIIQNQPSFLFEGTYNSKDTLFMVFSQYHFISKDDLDNLNQLDFDITDPKKEENSKSYRNVRNEEEVEPKVTLMSYSNSKYLENILFFIIIFLL